MDLEVEGLNLERLLEKAAESGILLRRVRRVDAGGMMVSVPDRQETQMRQLCERYGWQVKEAHAGLVWCILYGIKRKGTLAAGALLGVFLIFLSSQMVLQVEVLGAGEHEAEVFRCLEEAHISRWKKGVSTDELSDRLALRLPGLAHTAARFEGSTLVVDCRPARQGEQNAVQGSGMDIVAAQAGIVLSMSVQSGTPRVEPGQAVRRGQVLISGEEPTLEGTNAVQAEGKVYARVFSQGEARVSLARTGTVETGLIRQRVTLESPWSSRVVVDAKPFKKQDVTVVRQPIVGLYLPVWRRIETMAEVVYVPRERAENDARSQAQGAAEKIAKLNCPPGTEILEKWVEYSIIENEMVCAKVVLEYEKDIAGRISSE